MPMPPQAADVTLIAPRLFDGIHWHDDAVVSVRAGTTVAVGPRASVVVPPEAVRLPPGTMLAPGFIDCQVNGGGGVLLNATPTRDGVTRMQRAHRPFGATGIMATWITDSRESLAALAADPALFDCPGVCGVHLEGPFLNVRRKGVHPASFIRVPDEHDLAVIARLSRVARVVMTLAPECVPAGFVAALCALGVRVSIGHSEATHAQVVAALDAGATGVTHLFNAMSSLSAREPGVVGAAFDDARIIAGLICDGIHVAPANMRTAFKAMGRDRIALVTDAMPSVGAAEPHFELHGRTITLNNGRLTAPDGTLAGAHLTMIDAVRNATTLMGASLTDALIMASRTPARFLGLGASQGRIAAGFAADFVAISADLRVHATWLGGQSCT